MNMNKKNFLPRLKTQIEMYRLQMLIRLVFRVWLILFKSFAKVRINVYINNVLESLQQLYYDIAEKIYLASKKQNMSIGIYNIFNEYDP